MSQGSAASGANTKGRAGLLPRAVLGARSTSPALALDFDAGVPRYVYRFDDNVHCFDAENRHMPALSGYWNAVGATVEARADARTEWL